MQIDLWRHKLVSENDCSVLFKCFVSLEYYSYQIEITDKNHLQIIQMVEKFKKIAKNYRQSHVILE